MISEMTLKTSTASCLVPLEEYTVLVEPLGAEKLSFYFDLAPTDFLAEDFCRLGVSGLRERLPQLMKIAESSQREVIDFVIRCTPGLVGIDVSDRERIEFEQDNGQNFGLKQISDGVICLMGLAVTVYSAPRGSILFVSEPERQIHPRYHGEIDDLMRQAICNRDVRVVMTTNSPTLLNRFRDEPESIVVLRRQPLEARRFSDSPALMDALVRSMPGELFETGFIDALAWGKNEDSRA